MNKKIVSIENLKKIILKLRNKRKKIVLCHGVFDLLHVGHINYFQEARNYGDILVVSVTSDEYVNKGPNRPAFSEENRLKALAALDIIDYVVLSKNLTGVFVIQELKPDFYCKGPDYKFHKNDISGEIKNEISAVKKNGGKIVYTQGVTFSSSNLINKYSQTYTSKQKSAINKIKKKYSFVEISRLIENFKKLKVLVIGETIIDQYVFCDALGKSGKESVLVLKDLNTEQYLGGAAAVSRHLSHFCKKITLLSMLGEKCEFLKEIKQKLPKNIKFNYIKKKNSPTIVKKRFLDEVNRNKVLGVYKINDDALTDIEEKLFISKLRKLLANHDLVIVSDYGHGLISKKSSQIICKNSKYLALNVQINAANIGYHSMKKYKNVDCVVINEKEIRHELRNRSDNIESLIKKLSQEQKIKNLVVTRGVYGSILYEKKNNKFVWSDAFAKSVVDKIGAGDAMLSLIALSLKSGFSKELGLLIGSLTAAHSVETMGNKETANKLKILKSIEHLVK
jgi:rfaE bifunctional protein kinase chain/domain/rfaE bifunctional protein nucleotidyltransferase chain/domain